MACPAICAVAVLDLGGLVAGRHPAVDPFGLVHNAVLDSATWAGFNTSGMMRSMGINI